MNVLYWKRAAACVAMALIASTAMAQTVVNAPPPDPQLTSLRDRVDMLETELRSATGENERLQFELKKSHDENALLKRTIADMGAQAPGASPAPAPAASGKLGDLSASEAPASEASGDPAVMYAEAYALVAKSDFKNAQAALASFLSIYPNDLRAPDARYYLGQTLLVDGAPSEAAAQFLTIVQKTPKAAKAPEAMVRLGVALNRMGKKTEACSTLKAVRAQYPKAPAAKAAAAAQIKAIGCAAG